MANIAPEAFEVLLRIKRYGLESWLPGKLVISKLHDSTFTRVNARIISDLIARGYLVVDGAGAVSAALAGDHELHHGRKKINETLARVGGQLFQVITEDWAIEDDALRVRKLVLGGLAFVAENDPAQFRRIQLRTSNGQEDEALEAIVVSAVSLVTAHYSDQFAGRSHRVGVRALSGPERRSVETGSLAS